MVKKPNLFLRFSGLLLIALLIPPVIFFFVALANELSFGTGLSYLVDQYRTPKQNLLIIGGLNLFPLLLVVLGLWLHRRFGGHPALQSGLLLGGALPVFAIEIWANLEYWPSFLPARAFLGFPHGLEFLIAPVFFAPVGVLAGMVLTWLLLRRNLALYSDPS